MYSDQVDISVPWTAYHGNKDTSSCDVTTYVDIHKGMSSDKTDYSQRTFLNILLWMVLRRALWSIRIYFSILSRTLYNQAQAVQSKET